MSSLISLGSREPGSYRDPSGYVHVTDNRVFRTVMQRASAEYEFVRDSGLLKRLQERGMLVRTAEVEKSEFANLDPQVAYVLEHEVIPWVSYPYEWCFSALRSAAVLQLDVQIEALRHDVALSDASAYNIQFVGSRPVFIDVLSFRKYREGEFWVGHRQFCEQFLNPLLLGARLGVRHNAWYRGNLEGIDTLDFSKLLGWRDKLSWNIFSNVFLQAKLQQGSLRSSTAELSKLKERTLPRNRYEAMLRSLRDWVSGLTLRDTGESVWEKYSSENTYSNDEAQLKHRVIEAFASREKPRLAWDLGCNTGEYSESLLKGGAQYVVGMDFDQGALENAFERSRKRKLPFLALYQDAANQSPNQGWRGLERSSIVDRRGRDAVIALAFEHHLAIGRNIPLQDVVEWLGSHARCGVIEFVQKTDPTIRRMLALREDIFDDYTEQAFVSALERIGRITERVPVSDSGRVLFCFERDV